jgi:hypothetical protein
MTAPSGDLAGFAPGDDAPILLLGGGVKVPEIRVFPAIIGLR